MAELLRCEICGAEDENDLIGHILHDHDIPVETYLRRHPGASVESSAMKEAWTAYTEGVVRTPVVSGTFSTEFHGCNVDVHLDVPSSACASLPPHYVFPHGKEASRQASRILRYIVEGRSVWIYGVPGIGKDALVHYISASCRKPFRFFSIQPEAKIQDWFWSLGFQNGESTWVEGALLKALRDGYTDALGRTYPYLILLSDLDRATPSQIERLRTLLDTDEKRVPLPSGEYAPILPGTTIVATANTMGEGDETGRIVSARRIDASILNRFECKVQMVCPEWEDLLRILQKSHEDEIQRLKVHGLVTALKNATEALQQACTNGTLYGEFSLRDLRNILNEFRSLIAHSKGTPSIHTILLESFDVYTDGLGTSASRDAARQLIAPHFKNPSQWTGDSEVNDRELGL